MQPSVHENKLCEPTSGKNGEETLKALVETVAMDMWSPAKNL